MQIIIYILTLVLVNMPILVGQNHSIVLQSANNSAEVTDGIVSLVWYIPNEEVSDIVFQLQRYELDKWTLVMQAKGETFYNDSLFICDKTLLKYRVKAFGNFLNMDTIISNEIELNVYDITPPKGEEIDSVSIIDYENVEIGWQKSTTADAISYVILYNIENFDILLDSITDLNTPYYLDKNAKDKEFRRYKIAVEDRCGNRSIYSEYKWGFETKASYRFCADSLEVAFSSPENTIEGKDSLYLYAHISDDTQNFVSKLIAKVGYDENHIFKIGVNNENLNSTYRVSVGGYANGIWMTASALYDSLYGELPDKPEFFDIKKLSIKPKNITDEDFMSDRLELVLQIDTNNIFKNIQIYKDDKSIIDIAYREDLLKNPTYTQIIENREVNKEIQYYSAQLMDECGSVIETAQHNTIYLQPISINEKVVSFQWNTYNNWAENNKLLGTNFYEIDLADNSKSHLDFIASEEGSELYTSTYTISNLEELQNKVFFVELVSKNNLLEPNMQEFYSDTVYSNYTKARNNLGENLFYMASGFVPGGFTERYKPIGIFKEDDKFEFRIYNRLGILMFQTTDYNMGWDGTYKSKYVEASVYVYSVYLQRDGQEIKRNGSFTLIR